MSVSKSVITNGEAQLTKMVQRNQTGVQTVVVNPNSLLMLSIWVMIFTSKYLMMINLKMNKSEVEFQNLAHSQLAMVLMIGSLLNSMESLPVKFT
jgi:O-antigen ligase